MPKLSRNNIKMKVFLINLDKRPDRLAFVKNQLDNQNIDFERFVAVDGSKMTLETQTLVDVKRFIIEQKKEPVIGEVGCAMSHRAIWQKMVDENLEYALILEDDITLSSDLSKLLKAESFYKQFDFLNLSSSEPYHPDLNVLNQLVQQDIIQRKDAHRCKALWSKLEWRNQWRIFAIHALNDKVIACECDPAPALASGYILSKKGAFHLLEASQPLHFPIDLVWRYTGGELRQAFLAESMIVQTLNDTNIEGRYKGYKLNFMQRVQRIFLKNRRKQRKADVRKIYGKN